MIQKYTVTETNADVLEITTEQGTRIILHPGQDVFRAGWNVVMYGMEYPDAYSFTYVVHGTDVGDDDGLLAVILDALFDSPDDYSGLKPEIVIVLNTVPGRVHAIDSHGNERDYKSRHPDIKRGN